MVTVQNGRMVPLSFADMRDPQTGKTRVRNVDPHSANFRVARNFMIRLDPGDFQDKAWLEKVSRAGNLPAEDFCNRFQHLVGTTRS